MRTPKTRDEYLDLVDQAILEVDELLLCAEDEGGEDDEFSSLSPLYEQLIRDLKKLHTGIFDGSHTFADGSDMSFMPLVRKWKRRIPFSNLLETLNSVHKTGF